MKVNIGEVMQKDNLVEQIPITFLEPLTNTLNHHAFNFHLITKL
jgi:hypothetical protein